MAAKAAENAKALPEGEGGGKKKSRGKRIAIFMILLLIILGAAGGAGYWYFYLRTPAVAEKAEGTKETPQKDAVKSDGQQVAQGNTDSNAIRIERQSDLPRNGGIVVPLPSLTVNLVDPSGRRYLKIGMEVELNEDVTAQLQQQAARVRDAIIMLLAGKQYSDIATPDGKVLLKGELAARLNQILGGQRVIRVYFTEFVVQ